MKVFASCAILALCACSADAGDVPAGVSVSVDSSGVVPVVSVAGNPPVWALDSIAVLRAEDDVGFSRVRSIALDPRGGVWVADVGEHRLSRYDDAGAWVEDRGRVGSGPGEFRSPYGIVVYEGGLLVHDPGNSRIMRFPLDGGPDSSWLTTVRLTGGAMFVRFYPDPEGPLLADHVRDTGPPRNTFRRLVDDALIRAPAMARPLDDAKVCPSAGAIHFFGSPFSPGGVVAPVGGGTVRAEGGDYRLEYFDGSSRPMRTVTRSLSRDTVSQAEFDSASADWQKYAAENSTTGCTGTIERYRLKPAIRALLPDADGRLWVETRQPGGFVYEVWTGDTLLARVPPPLDFAKMLGEA